jgi:hypothetical protein
MGGDHPRTREDTNIMPNLPTRLRDAAEALNGRSPDLYGGRPPARVQRAVREGVAIEQGRGLIQAARVQAVHYVAHTAARAVEDLTDMEALAISRNPLAEPRLRAINPDLNISYNGASLDPTQEIVSDTILSVPVRTDSTQHGDLKLRIIEWRQGKHRAIYYGPDDQHFVHEEVGSDVESQFPFSAYTTLARPKQAGWLPQPWRARTRTD